MFLCPEGTTAPVEGGASKERKKERKNSRDNEEKEKEKERGKYRLCAVQET